MKLFALIACAVLVSPLTVNAQNMPAPGTRPDLPGFAANRNQMPAPAQRPGMPGQPGMRPGMPGRPGLPAPAPRILETNQPLSITPSEEPQVIIYNGIRIGIQPNTEVTLSMDKGQLKIEAPVFDGISIGNSAYSTVNPSPATPEDQLKDPVAATVFVNPTDGAVFVPQKSVPVFVSVPSGDIIEINPFISLKGDISGALSQEGPVVVEPVTAEPEPVVQETPATPQPPVEVAPEVAPVVSDASSSSTEPETASDTEDNFIENVDDEVAPSVIEESQGEIVKEEEILSPSIRPEE